MNPKKDLSKDSQTDLQKNVEKIEEIALPDFSDFLPNVKEFYLRVPVWWKKNFSQEKLENYSLISQGQSNICFEINGKYILKIYASKYQYGQANEAKLQTTFQTLKKFDQDFASLDFIPKNLVFYENDQTFGANLVLMEKVEAVDLFEIFYKFDQKEQTTLFEQSLWQLRKLHYSQTKQEQTYSTKEYLDQTLTEISANLEKIKDKIPKDLEAQIHEIIQKYKFKELRENFYLLHNDFHLANVLINQQSKLFFIDLDRSILGPLWLEMETILDMVFFPRGMATLELEPFYKDSLLYLLPTLVKIYPELLLFERLEEIKISFLRTIMGKLSSNSFRKQAIKTFELVFEKQVLENVVQKL